MTLPSFKVFQQSSTSAMRSHSPFFMEPETSLTERLNIKFNRSWSETLKAKFVSQFVRIRPGWSHNTSDPMLVEWISAAYCCWSRLWKMVWRWAEFSCVFLMPRFCGIWRRCAVDVYLSCKLWSTEVHFRMLIVQKGELLNCGVSFR